MTATGAIVRQRIGRNPDSINPAGIPSPASPGATPQPMPNGFPTRTGTDTDFRAPRNGSMRLVPVERRCSHGNPMRARRARMPTWRIGARSNAFPVGPYFPAMTDMCLPLPWGRSRPTRLWAAGYAGKCARLDAGLLVAWTTRARRATAILRAATPRVATFIVASMSCAGAPGSAHPRRSKRRPAIVSRATTEPAASDSGS